MTVLPSQKLSIGELFVSLAAGLMLFLLPNDAKNHFEFPASESCITLFSLIIIFTLYVILKRFEAVGSAMLTTAVLSFISIVFSILGGVISKKEDYWPTVSEYNVVSMFITWIIPFFCMTVLRLLMSGYYDTSDKRRGYSRFLTFSMYALMIIYGIVIIFKMIVPYKPNTDMPRELDFVVFNQINHCLSGVYEEGIKYIFWHTLILVPLSFYLLVLIPKLSWWQIMIIAFTFGCTIEILQYSFNTGTACVDDVFMYIVGTVIGILLKHSIDKLRAILTFGQDECMLSLDYSSNKKKKSDNAFAVIE